MKTFFVFKLNREFNKIARKSSENVYTLLKTLYTHDKKDYLIAYNLFDEMCMNINKGFFDLYLYERLQNDDSYTKFNYVHMYYDYIKGESSKITINNCYMKIKSNIERNIFIDILDEIDNLFICDFKNDYYVLSGDNNKILSNKNLLIK